MDDPNNLKDMKVSVYRFLCDGPIAAVAFVSNRSGAIRVERLYADGSVWMRTDKDWKFGGSGTNWERLENAECTGKFVALYWLNPSGEPAELPTYEDD